MKEKLIELLKLDAGATEEQILAAVTELKFGAKAKGITNAREKKIREKIAESGGALTYDQAVQVIEHQDGF